MKKNVSACLAALFALAASGMYYYFFVRWIPVMYVVTVFCFSAAAGLLAVYFADNHPVRRGLITGGVFMAGFFGAGLLVNNVIFKAQQNRLSAVIIAGLTLLAFICMYCVFSRKKKKRRVFAAVVFALGVILFACSLLPGDGMNWIYKQTYKQLAAPKAGSTIEEKEAPMVDNADLYVAPDGSDDNDGSLDKPFLTVDKARDAVREMDKTGKTGITVAIKAGEYRVSSFVLTEEDSGTKECPVTYCAYGDGEVVFNGGVTLPHDAFKAADEDMKSRLTGDAKEKVLAVDLFALGITKEEYGRIYAIGGYNQASRYDGDWVGDIYCELFIDDMRQTIARYPNGREYLYTGEVVFEGEGRESASARVKPDYESIRNPKPDIYKMDKALSDRIASWKTLDDVWMFGYWRYDWADGSTPVGTVDHENLTLSPMFASGYGAIKDAPYYFFNVFEELDVPGEWYLDRENGVLYFYPPEGFSDASAVELSLSKDNIIRAECDYVTFDGITVKGTRGDAVSFNGDGNTVRNCLIKNVAGNALIMAGYGNLAARNEITRTGKGGVILSGGDRETLKHGENRAENNLVHDWSEIYETYQPAFTLNGVGNICTHNEMYNSPHEAITYSGNDHLIEYNLIHNVNLLTDDGGAIYSGRRWDWYGTVIRYNLIYDLGADGHRPQGIYMDDCLAGQTIYGNVMVNVPNFGLQLGGGQDLIVHDNIVVNSLTPISFDARGRSGLSGDEENSFYQHYKENGEVWKLLFESPWKTEAWQTAYPQYKRYSDDFSNPDDPNFVINPGNGEVTHNLLVSPSGTIGDISEEAMKYSKIEDNACFKLSALNKLFVDPENGDYTLKDDAPIGFAIDVPAMEDFGRQP